MEVLWAVAGSFIGSLAVLGTIEVAAENSSAWNSEYAANYFWSIPADPNGSEAERLAYELTSKPMDWSESELCRIVDPADVSSR